MKKSALLATLLFSFVWVPCVHGELIWMYSYDPAGGGTQGSLSVNAVAAKMTLPSGITDTLPLWELGIYFNQITRNVFASELDVKVWDASGAVPGAELYSVGTALPQMASPDWAYVDLKASGVSLDPVTRPSVFVGYTTGLTNIVYPTWQQPAVVRESFRNNPIIPTVWSELYPNVNEADWVMSLTVPEPSTFVLLGTGVVGLVPFVWRRRKGSA